MTLRRVSGSLLLSACLAVPVCAQQAPVNATAQTSSSSESQDQAAPAQNQPVPSEQPSSDTTKKESKAKKKAKDLIPYCVGIGSAGKCRHDEDREEAAKREAAEEDLRRHCREAADQSQPEIQSCAELRKRDAAHDVEVGDTYLDQKSYNPAVMRYRSALQTDPTNATAMLHLAQALEKLGQKDAAYEQYQNYLKTDPSADDAKRARAALERLKPGATVSK